MVIHAMISKLISPQAWIKAILLIAIETHTQLLFSLGIYVQPLRGYSFGNVIGLHQALSRCFPRKVRFLVKFYLL